LGDNKYYGSNRERLKEISDKLYLHAYQIDLTSVYGKKMLITAPLPKHFVTALEFFGLEK